MRILIKDIKQLVQVEEKPRGVIKGEEMKVLPSIENAYVLIKDDTINDFGEMAQSPEDADIIISANGKIVLPGWCDSHTHLVHAGSREAEFIDRINGLTYEQIAKNGGGILNSAKLLNETSEEELVQQSFSRLNEIKMQGTGAVEIKSGYGLTLDGELKMLRAIKKLKGLSPLTIKSTFLGAHAIPLEYNKNRSGYIDLIINEMLPVIREERLADYIDVFCDTGFFTSEETDIILEAGIKNWLAA